MTTGGQLILPMTLPVIDNSGLLVVGATLSVFISGSGFIANLFGDQGLTTPITNPQTSDSAGRFFSQFDHHLGRPLARLQLLSGLSRRPDLPSSSRSYPVSAPIEHDRVRADQLADLHRRSASADPGQQRQLQQDRHHRICEGAELRTAQLAGPYWNADRPDRIPRHEHHATRHHGVRDGGAGHHRANRHFQRALQLRRRHPPVDDVQRVGLPSASVTVNWPTTFPTAVLGLPWLVLASGFGFMPGVTSANTTQCTITKGSGDPSAHTGTVWAFGN